ncbi:MAG: hypothetical protein JO282_15990 [Alphaproteobacteria bacterium]|nr:hypothetical protein [Alphaproteobacteria bacterium]
MNEAGLDRRLREIGRTILLRLSLAALGLNLASTMATAISPPNAIGVPSEDFCVTKGQGRVLRADPSNYRELVSALQAGDTLLLASGRYPLLTVANLNGGPGRCITIAGPAAGARAVIVGQTGHNTVEIVDSSYIVVSNLTIDSLGLGGDGIKAPRTTHQATHHIILNGNLIIGAGAVQQTDGISTKTPTWNWVIRRNAIAGAGTGIYLGDSDGSSPFIAGIIENNLVLNPLGYCMEIKHQLGRPALAGVPQGPQSTIIRNNVFIKDDRSSPDGDRPNLLVGGFPDTGSGSHDLYQIYGNLFLYNPREALFQGSGRISFHDNILVGGQAAGALFRDHDLPLRLAHIFNNTIYSPQIGIKFGNPAREGHAVLGNLIFAETPIIGLDVAAQDNLVALPAEARNYVRMPSSRLGAMDFYPLPGRVTGSPLDLSSFAGELDFDRDFNGVGKDGHHFRGAYAGEGMNPGWRLGAQIKTNK